MDDRGELVVRRGDVEARPISGPATAQEAVVFLDRAEQRLGAPLVDEAERERLEHATAGRAAEGWRGLLARRGSTVVGYGGVVLTPQGTPDDSVIGDAAVDRDHGPAPHGLAALLAGLNLLAGAEPRAQRLVVWLRHVRDEDRVAAEAEGFVVERRLGILGRALGEGADLPLPSTEGRGGTRTVRAYRPERDDDAMVEILAAAYEGTDEAGWDHDRFHSRRALPWFRPEDLLLAEDETGRVDGLAWIKRRGEGVGELYNLAIHPRAQGEGLGVELLTAALRHLATSCSRILLWVDLANERAVRLYRSQGFTTLWEDVAVLRPAGARVETRT